MVVIIAGAAWYVLKGSTFPSRQRGRGIAGSRAA
jgi:hypothetical protein